VTTRRSRLRRWLVLIALALLLLFGGAVVFLRVRFHGPGLANELQGMLNQAMRGRITIRSIDWPMSALPQVVSGGWVPVTVEDANVFDADGKQLLHAERLTGEIDIHALMFGNHDLVFRHVVLDGGWVLLEEIPQPYPLHAYDTKVISLFAAFYGKRTAGFYSGVTAGSSPIFDVRDFHVRNLDATLRFGVQTETNPDGSLRIVGYGLEAVADNVSGGGLLFADASDPLVPKVYFSLPTSNQPIRAEHAEVTAAGRFHFSLDTLALERFAQLPVRWPDDPIANTLELRLSAHSIDGADIALDGKLLEYWDSPFGGTYDVHAEITNAGAMAKHSIDTGMGGDNLSISADVSGPIVFPKVHAQMRDLEYSVALRELKDPLLLYLDDLEVDFDSATETGRLRQAIARVHQPKRDGEVQLSATFGLSPYNVDAQIAITQPIDLRTWLPDQVAHAFGTDVRGALHATGDADLTLQVDDLDLHLGTLHVRDGAIYARHKFSRFELEHLHAEAGRTSVAVDGDFDAEHETFSLDLDLQSGDFDHWLTKFGAPALARTAHGRGLHAEGSLDTPTAGGTIALGGVPVIDDFTTTFTYGGSALTIVRGESHKVGEVHAHGKIDLAPATPRAEHIVITGRGLDLSKLPVPSLVAGKADFDAVVDGPVTAPRVDAVARSDDISIAGQKTNKLRACLNHDPDDPVCAEAATLSRAEVTACTADSRAGGQCLVAGLVRADGGSASLYARTDARERLAGRATIEQLPLDAVAQVSGSGELPAGGSATVNVDLGGTLSAPTASGTIAMLRTWVFGAYLGDERFEVRVASSDDPRAECAPGRPPPSKTSTGKLALCGSLKDGRIVVAAVLGTSGTFPLHAEIDLQRVEVDPFVDLGKLLGTPAPVRAWTSGTITVKTELMRENPPLDVRVELPDLAVTVQRTDADGRPAPLTMRNDPSTPLSVAFDGKNVVLGRPVTFQTPAGTLTVSGQATQDRLDLAVHGVLDLADIQPFIAAWFDHAEGQVTIDGSVTGTFAAPEVRARMALKDILMRPAGQDTELSVDDARLDLDPEHGLTLTSLAVKVSDPSSGEHAMLAAKGGIKLDGFTPSRWALIIDGELAGKMLQAFAPQQIAQASGVAHLSLSVSGAGNKPEIEGDLQFDGKRPLAIMPRGFRRELILSGGSISFTQDQVNFDDVSGSIDDEGRLSHVTGDIELVDGAPVEGDITLSADGIPFRVPRTLDLVLSADRLSVIWQQTDQDGDGFPDMEVDGTVEIVQGRYLRSFKFEEFLRPETSTSVPSKPFWEEYPMLGHAKLKLDIEANSLQVVNNIADIELTGAVELLGTPRDPRVDGEIRVVRGTFKPQFTRARFTETRGTVSFQRFSRFPQDTPTMSVRSEADFRDASGQDHKIILAVEGPLSRLKWDLTTSSGLTKGQTFALIVSGRTSEDVQRTGSATEAEPGQIDPTTNPSDSAADQLIKGFAGDLVSLLVAEPLKDIDILDVARIEVGTGSIGFHGERKVYSNTNVVGDVEQTVRGRTVNVRMEIKSTIGLNLELGWLKKDYDDPAEEDVTDREAKLVYRIPIP